MTGFEFKKVELNDAYYIKNFYQGDLRGGFTKCFEKEIFANAGIAFDVYETFVSVSEKNVIRGIHFQLDNPQSKLVSVLSGSVWDVMVDLRPESTTYQKWVAMVLSAEKHNAFYVPKGFGHGFLALDNNTVMMYQCDGKYEKNSDTGILIDDPKIAIDWPIKLENAILSDRDRQLMTMQEYEQCLK